MPVRGPPALLPAKLQGGGGAEYGDCSSRNAAGREDLRAPTPAATSAGGSPAQSMTVLRLLAPIRAGCKRRLAEYSSLSPEEVGLPLPALWPRAAACRATRERRKTLHAPLEAAA